MLKAKAGGRSELLIVEGAISAQNPNTAGFTPLASLITSSGIDEMLKALLGQFIAVETLAEGEAAIRSHSSLIAVTRDGDLISRTRVRGGSAGSQSAIEINALLARTQENLDQAIARCETLSFELIRCSDEVAAARVIHDQALARLNESDAKMSGLAEQMAVAGQNVKSALAEVERLAQSEREAAEKRAKDEGDLATALAQFESAQEPAEPDLSQRE
jgi:chromosome segregation protein